MRPEIKFGFWIAKTVIESNITRQETKAEVTKRVLAGGDNLRKIEQVSKGATAFDLYDFPSSHELRPRRVLRFPKGVRLPQIRKNTQAPTTKIPNT